MAKRSHTRAFLQETPVIEWSENARSAWMYLIIRRGRHSLPRAWRRRLDVTEEHFYEGLHCLMLKDFRSGLKTQAYVAAIWMRALAVVLTELRIKGEI